MCVTRVVTGRDAGGMESYPASEVAGGIVRLAAWSTVAVLLASPGAWAQTSTKLTGNVDQSSASSLSWTSYDGAQAFTMSVNPEGYKLTEVGIYIVIDVPTAPTPPTYSVSIHSNSGGFPGSNLGTLTNPSELVDGEENRFTASGEGIDLDADTTYFVVVDVSASGNKGVKTALTSSDTDDSDTAGEGNIGDTSLYRAYDTSNPWATSAIPLMVAIYGYAKASIDPTPEDPTPEDPTPEDPTPEDPTPEDPTPEDPTPEDPTPETTAPAVTGAATDITGTTITVGFRRAMDTSILPATSAFTLSGTSATVSSVRFGDATTLYLDLGEAIRGGERVTLGYARPETNALQDASGTALAGFRRTVDTSSIGTGVPAVPPLGLAVLAVVLALRGWRATR